MNLITENNIFTTLNTPLGDIWLGGNGESLSRLNFLSHINRPDQTRDGSGRTQWRYVAESYPEARRQLSAYFAAELQQFDLPLAPKGTEFQCQVWLALRQLDYGAICSYADIAKRINRPKAVRAVGAANGANPLPIIVPCHRVIGSSGKLTGFAGGLHLKTGLLRLEGLQIDSQSMSIKTD